MEGGAHVIGTIPALVHGWVRAYHVVVGHHVLEAQLLDPPPVGPYCPCLRAKLGLREDDADLHGCSFLRIPRRPGHPEPAVRTGPASPPLPRSRRTTPAESTGPGPRSAAAWRHGRSQTRGRPAPWPRPPARHAASRTALRPPRAGRPGPPRPCRPRPLPSRARLPGARPAPLRAPPRRTPH